jgi:hypothetical protein
MEFLMNLKIAIAAIVSFSALSHAEIKPHLAQQFCGPAKELETVLSDYDRVLEGVAGVNGTHGRGEVWVNAKTGEWFFIQKAEDSVTACIVLGGSKFGMAVKGDGI